MWAGRKEGTGLAVRLVETKDMERQDWLQRRKAGIGGSDAAAICGLNPYKSPMQVWLEKTGQIESEDEQSEAAYWGQLHEAMVANEFKRRNGLNVQRRHAIFQHSEHPWMLANIDRIIISKEHGNGILECKTASEYIKDQWTDEDAPAAYVIQCLHYMAVMDVQYAWLAVLIGGNKYRQLRVERDDAAIANLIEIERKFWEQNVVKGIPPAWDGTPASTDLLAKMYPEGKPEATDLPADAADLIKQYEEASQAEKEWAQRKDEAANKLKGMLGEYEIGWLGGRQVSWRNVTTNRLDTKALQNEQPDIYEQYLKPSTYRRFAVR